MYAEDDEGFAIPPIPDDLKKFYKTTLDEAGFVKKPEFTGRVYGNFLTTKALHQIARAPKNKQLLFGHNSIMKDRLVSTAATQLGWVYMLYNGNVGNIQVKAKDERNKDVVINPLSGNTESVITMELYGIAVEETLLCKQEYSNIACYTMLTHLNIGPLVGQTLTTLTDADWEKINTFIKGECVSQTVENRVRGSILNAFYSICRTGNLTDKSKNKLISEVREKFNHEPLMSDHAIRDYWKAFGSRYTVAMIDAIMRYLLSIVHLDSVTMRNLVVFAQTRNLTQYYAVLEAFRRAPSFPWGLVHHECSEEFTKFAAAQVLVKETPYFGYGELGPAVGTNYPTLSYIAIQLAIRYLGRADMKNYLSSASARVNTRHWDDVIDKFINKQHTIPSDAVLRSSNHFARKFLWLMQSGRNLKMVETVNQDGTKSTELGADDRYFSEESSDDDDNRGDPRGPGGAGAGGSYSQHHGSYDDDQDSRRRGKRLHSSDDDEGYRGRQRAGRYESLRKFDKRQHPPQAKQRMTSISFQPATFLNPNTTSMGFNGADLGPSTSGLSVEAKKSILKASLLNFGSKKTPAASAFGLGDLNLGSPIAQASRSKPYIETEGEISDDDSDAEIGGAGKKKKRQTRANIQDPSDAHMTDLDFPPTPPQGLVRPQFTTPIRLTRSNLPQLQSEVSLLMTVPNDACLRFFDQSPVVHPTPDFYGSYYKPTAVSKSDPATINYRMSPISSEPERRVLISPNPQKKYDIIKYHEEMKPMNLQEVLGDVNKAAITAQALNMQSDIGTNALVLPYPTTKQDDDGNEIDIGPVTRYLALHEDVWQEMTYEVASMETDWVITTKGLLISLNILMYPPWYRCLPQDLRSYLGMFLYSHFGKDTLRNINADYKRMVNDMNYPNMDLIGTDLGQVMFMGEEAAKQYVDSLYDAAIKHQEEADKKLKEAVAKREAQKNNPQIPEDSRQAKNPDAKSTS